MQWHKADVIFLIALVVIWAAAFTAFWVAYRTGPRTMSPATRVTIDEYGMLLGGPATAIQVAARDAFYTDYFIRQGRLSAPTPQTALQAAAVKSVHSYHRGLGGAGDTLVAAARDLQVSMGERGLWFTRTAMRVMITCRYIFYFLPIAGVSRYVVTHGRISWIESMLYLVCTILMGGNSIYFERARRLRLPLASTLIRTGAPQWKPTVIESRGPVSAAGPSAVPGS